MHGHISQKKTLGTNRNAYHCKIQLFFSSDCNTIGMAILASDSLISDTDNATVDSYDAKTVH